jgi:hypothetical protein
MKRGLWILIIALVVGVAGFLVTRQQCQCDMTEAAAIHDGASLLPELAWLRSEFQLNEEQFDRVKVLHLTYKPTCEALCLKVTMARQKVKTLVTAGRVPSQELDAALQEQAAVHVECQKALLKHVHDTAALMSPAQAEQFLRAILPQVLGEEMSPDSHRHSH